MKFMVIVWAAFLARVNPVSTIAKPACMNITRNPATSVHTKLIATVFAAEAALAALASESVAATPCPARTSGHARVSSKAIPTERLIRSPSEGSHDALVLQQSCKNCTDYRKAPGRDVPFRLTAPAARGQLSRSSMLLHTNLPSGVCPPRLHGGRPQPAGRK